MKEFKKYLPVALVMMTLLLVGAPHALVAQTTPASTTPPAIDWGIVATKVVGIAAFVSTVLQGLKKLAPAFIQGNVAIALSVVGAVAISYAAAGPGDVLTLQFALTTISTALAANGIHGLAKLMGGNPPVPPAPPAA